MDDFLSLVDASYTSKRYCGLERHPDKIHAAFRAAIDGLIGELRERGYRYRLVNLDGDDRKGRRKAALRAKIIARKKDEEWGKSAPTMRKALEAGIEAEVEKLMSEEKGRSHE